MNLNHIKAIGFDLFNTLITLEPDTILKANEKLISSLKTSGFSIDKKPFEKAYRKAALEFLDKSRKDGRETHNSFWISAALKAAGYDVAQDDPRIALAVESYFSAFFPSCHLIPGTKEMLSSLKKLFRLGLLSNFTHPPAARTILENLGLLSFFDVLLISGDLGYRKPHPLTFRKLLEALEVQEDEILYIGDDPDSDIIGAQHAGIQGVWTTYVKDQNIAPATGLLLLSTGTPPSSVPRISSWKELFSFLAVPR